MLDISEMMYWCQDLGIIKSNSELSPGSRWQDVVHHRMPASHEPRGQVSLKWGGGRRVPMYQPFLLSLLIYTLLLIMRYPSHSDRRWRDRKGIVEWEKGHGLYKTNSDLSLLSYAWGTHYLAAIKRAMTSSNQTDPCPFQLLLGVRVHAFCKGLGGWNGADRNVQVYCRAVQ